MKARKYGRRRGSALVAAVCAAVVSGSLLGSGAVVGTPRAEAATLPGISSAGGWAEAAGMVSLPNSDKNMPAYPNQALAYSQTVTTVPKAPAVQTGQTLYYLSGLTNGYVYKPGGSFLGIQQGWDFTSYRAGIFTALAWNGNGSPGWTMAAWACDNNGCQQKSAAVAVSPGDQLGLYVTCVDGWGNCVTWQVDGQVARDERPAADDRPGEQPPA